MSRRFCVHVSLGSVFIICLNLLVDHLYLLQQKNQIKSADFAYTNKTLTALSSSNHAGNDVVKEIVRLLRYDPHPEEKHKRRAELTHGPGTFT